MNVALIGATGNAGSRILAELVRRGHRATAISRNPAKVPALPGVAATAGDVFDAEGLVALVAGHDAVISSVHFTASDPEKLI
ncbi:NAD(P)-dependent oxidoreductase, partial [Streptomyces galilaeus]|uniref:NAD(P)-dependent oxidoreductase n=1 Tax=Streptomyces galilaeus TaxID=33899 RepID=UPI0038F7CFCA